MRLLGGEWARDYGVGANAALTVQHLERSACTVCGHPTQDCTSHQKENGNGTAGEAPSGSEGSGPQRGR